MKVFFMQVSTAACFQTQSMFIP